MAAERGHDGIRERHAVYRHGIQVRFTPKPIDVLHQKDALGNKYKARFHLLKQYVFFFKILNLKLI